MNNYRVTKLMFFCISIAAMLLNACSAAPATPAPATATPVPEEITMAFFYDSGDISMLEMINEGVAEKEIGIKVKIVELSYDDVYKEQVKEGKANGSAYDLFIMDDPWIPEFASNKYLAKLTELGYQPDDGFIKSTLELGYWPPRSGARLPEVAVNTPSEIYALPIIGDVQVFTYRKDIITTPPQTWDDIKQIAETQADPAANRYIMAIRGLAGNPVASEWFPYLYSFGGEFFDDQWHPTINSAEGVAALEYFLDLLKYQPAGVADFDNAQRNACYLEGQCLTDIGWTGSILAAEDPRQSKVVGKSGWIANPKQVRSASEIGNFMIGIPNGSTKKEAALKFIEWFTSDETQLAFAQRRGIPVRTAVFENEDLQKSYPWLPAVEDALNNSFARPRTPEWLAVEYILGQHLHEAVIGKESAQQALDLAAQEITEYLTQKGYYK